MADEANTTAKPKTVATIAEAQPLAGEIGGKETEEAMEHNQAPAEDNQNLDKMNRMEKTIEKMALAIQMLAGQVSKKDLIVQAEKATAMPHDEIIETHVSPDSAVMQNRAVIGTEGAFVKGKQAAKPSTPLSKEDIEALVTERATAIVKASMPVPQGYLIDPISKSQVTFYDYCRGILAKERVRNNMSGSATPDQSFNLYQQITKDFVGRTPGDFMGGLN